MTISKQEFSRRYSNIRREMAERFSLVELGISP